MHSFGGGVVVTDDARLADGIRTRLPRAPSRRRSFAKKFARNALENVAFRTPAYQAALLAAGDPRIRAALVAFYDRIRYDGVLTSTAYGAWHGAFAARQLASLAARVTRRREVARAIVEGLRDRLAFIQEPPGVETNAVTSSSHLSIANPIGCACQLIRAGGRPGYRARRDHRLLPLALRRRSLPERLAGAPEAGAATALRVDAPARDRPRDLRSPASDRARMTSPFERNFRQLLAAAGDENRRRVAPEGHGGPVQVTPPRQ